MINVQGFADGKWWRVDRKIWESPCDVRLELTEAAKR